MYRDSYVYVWRNNCASVIGSGWCFKWKKNCEKEKMYSRYCYSVTLKKKILLLRNSRQDEWIFFFALTARILWQNNISHDCKILVEVKSNAKFRVNIYSITTD